MPFKLQPLAAVAHLPAFKRDLNPDRLRRRPWASKIYLVSAPVGVADVYSIEIQQKIECVVFLLHVPIRIHVSVSTVSPAKEVKIGDQHKLR
jgi:hypothetical protein